MEAIASMVSSVVTGSKGTPRMAMGGLDGVRSGRLVTFSFKTLGE